PIIGFSFGAVLTEFCGVLTQALGAKRHYEGPMGKSDRAFFVGALGLITGLAPALFKLWPALFIVATLLSVLTCLNRLQRALAALFLIPQFLGAEGIPHPPQNAPCRSPCVGLGIPFRARPISLGRNELVWDVRDFHPGLHVLDAARAPGARARVGGFRCLRFP